MTALSITAANVIWQSGPKLADQQAGEAFVAGAMVYLSAAGTWLKAQCDGTAVEAGSLGLGMALFTADVAGARGSIAQPGAIVAIGTGTAGVVYLPGRTAGTLIPAADLASSDKVTPAAIGIGSSQIQLGYMYNAGSALA